MDTLLPKPEKKTVTCAAEDNPVDRFFFQNRRLMTVQFALHSTTSLCVHISPPLHRIPTFQSTTRLHVFTPVSFRNLVVCSLLLRLLLKPINLLGLNTSLSLSLYFDSACLVCCQFLRDIGFFWRCRSLRWGELENLSFGIGCLDLRSFVTLQFLEVKILDKIRC